MGNQRAIEQVEPFRCRGAVIRVRPGAGPGVREWLDANDRFYTHFYEAGEAVDFPNLDGERTHLAGLAGEHVGVQSGGKMWCGYDAFVDNLRHLAPSLEDARLYVADETTTIDEIRIRSGALLLTRVYDGAWCPLGEFLASAASGRRG